MPSEDAGPAGEFWTRPLLRVRNLQDSLRYYRDRLGFVDDWIDGTSSPPTCAQVSRNGVTVILDERAYFPKAALPSVLSVTLNDAVEAPALDALHRELLASGATIRRAPFKVVWDEHVHELDVEDPDGNVLAFWGYMPRAGGARSGP
jgi:uncharacterized glyoxalase superfamily protein PhnB